MKKKYLYLILLLSLILKLYQLGMAQFWYDEAFTRLISGLPFDRMIQATAGDTHPPGYYLITWGLVHLGLQDEFWLRLPSVVFSLLTTVVVWQIVSRLNWGEGSKYAAVVVVTFMPFTQHFSQEARMYNLLSLIFAAGILAVLDGKWWVIVASCAGLMWVHNYGVFYAPVLILLAFIRWPERKWSWISGGALAVTAWLPWAYVLIGQMKDIKGEYWIQPVTPGGVIYALYMNFFNFAVPVRWQPAAVMVITAMFLLLVIELITARPDKWWIFILAGLLPAALAISASFAWQPLFLFRGLAGSGMVLAMGYGWMIGKNKYRVFYALLLVLPVVIAGYWGHNEYNVENKGDITPLVESIKGENVFVYDDGQVVLAIYSDLNIYHIPPCEVIRGELSETTRRALDYKYARPEDFDEEVYIIKSIGPLTPSCMAEQIERDLADAEQVYVWREDEFVSVEVWKK